MQRFDCPATVPVHVTPAGITAVRGWDYNKLQIVRNILINRSTNEVLIGGVADAIIASNIGGDSHGLEGSSLGGGINRTGERSCSVGIDLVDSQLDRSTDGNLWECCPSVRDHSSQGSSGIDVSTLAQYN